MSTSFDMIKEVFAKIGSIGIGSSRDKKMELMKVIVLLRTKCFFYYDTPKSLEGIYPSAAPLLFGVSESSTSGIGRGEEYVGEEDDLSSVAAVDLESTDPAATSPATFGNISHESRHESSGKSSKKKHVEEIYKEDPQTETIRRLAEGHLQMQMFMQESLRATMVGQTAATQAIADLAKLMTIQTAKEDNVSGARLLSIAPAKDAYNAKVLESTKLVCDKLLSLMIGAWGTLLEDLPRGNSDDQRVFVAAVFDLLSVSSDSENVSMLALITLPYKAASAFESFSALSQTVEAVNMHLIVSDRVSSVKDLFGLIEIHLDQHTRQKWRLYIGTVHKHTPIKKVLKGFVALCLLEEFDIRLTSDPASLPHVYAAIGGGGPSAAATSKVIP